MSKKDMLKKHKLKMQAKARTWTALLLFILTHQISFYLILRQVN